MSDRRIGFVGLGVMGEPMCRNLVRKSGRSVACHDLSTAAMHRLAVEGAEPFDDPAELVRASDVFMMCLPSGRAVIELMERLLPEVRAGQVFVDLGTSGVEVARDAENRLRERGARFLDAPIARTRQAAEEGTLSIMVGGDAACLDEVRPLLDCLATDVTHCGPVGAGQAAKILNNMVLFETGLALAEAHAIARRGGFDPELMFHALMKGSGDSFALRNHGMKSIVPGKYPTQAFSVRYARKDLAYALSMAESLGIVVNGARAVDRSFAAAIAAGDGERYWPVITRAIEDGADSDRAPDTP